MTNSRAATSSRAFVLSGITQSPSTYLLAVLELRPNLLHHIRVFAERRTWIKHIVVVVFVAVLLSLSRSLLFIPRLRLVVCARATDQILQVIRYTRCCSAHTLSGILTRLFRRFTNYIVFIRSINPII